MALSQLGAASAQATGALLVRDVYDQQVLRPLVPSQPFRAELQPCPGDAQLVAASLRLGLGGDAAAFLGDGAAVDVSVNGHARTVNETADMAGVLHVSPQDGSFFGEAVMQLGEPWGLPVDLQDGTLDVQVSVKGVQAGDIVLAYTGARGFCRD